MSKLVTPQAQDPLGSILTSFVVPNLLLGEVTAKPADATPGFQPGAICWVSGGTAAANTCVYMNFGTAASCTFKALNTTIDLSSLVTTATELNLLSGLLATAAELNRNNKASTRGIALSTATSITAALHEGKDLFLAGSGSSLVQSLPAATGTFGRYNFHVAVVNTSNHVITAAGSDVFKGSINISINNSATTKAFTSTTNQNITFNGSTTGGQSINSHDLTLIDYATGVWLVSGQTVGSGALATPFS